MKASELAALKRIVRDRFALLNSQLNARASEIIEAERQRVLDEHKTAIKKHEGSIKKINEKMRKLHEEYRAAVDAAEADGVTPVYSRESMREYDWKLVPRELSNRSSYRNDPKVDVAKIKAVLKEQELTLMEQLLVSGIESEDAKAFLAQIPTVEQLVTGQALASQTSKALAA